MLKTRFIVLCVSLMVISAASSARLARAADDRAAADRQERPLIEVLKSDAPPQDKAITCKRLAIYGSKEAVPELAKLLPNPELSSWARIALEVIPDPAADAALREALDQVHGRLLIGVINSIAVRRDAKAVDGLARRLQDGDAEVAAAAAVALGHIGNDAASTALQQALAGAPDAVRSAIATGCILCAEQRLEAGKTAAAVALYDLVRTADVPKQRLLEAVRGAIVARQSAGAALLVEQLESTDKDRFQLGLMTARELAGAAVTEALVAELAKTTPDRQALLLPALADRCDAAVLPAVLQAARSGPAQVRAVALGVVARVGNVSSVPVLLEIAVESDAELASMASKALENLPGEDVDADLARRLPQASGTKRRILIELAGRRRIAAAVPALRRAADDSDGQVRAAALAALGSTVGPEDLSLLIGRVVAAKDPAELPAAAKALRTACIRMADREACARQLVAAVRPAPLASRRAVLEILGAMGGPQALAAVGAAAKDSEPELQDEASRLLGKWMTADAAPVLLDLAQTASAPKYKVRALRGYIRIVRQFNMSAQQRAEMCRNALQAAARAEEKKLVLQVLQRHPNIDMLAVAVAATKDPALKDDATAVAQAIAQKIGGKSAAVRKLLAEVGGGPVEIEIIEAQYGAGTTMKDVTATLRRHVHDLPLIVLPSTSYNASFGGDPVPGIVKQLRIRYRINGKTAEVSLPENATILLPLPGA